MKQTTSNSKNTMNKEANTHRKINMSWGKIENTLRYRSESAKHVYESITKKIEAEVLDGILLNLSIKSQSKPTSVQNRILRRIVEKRQAQANHKKHGRSKDLSSIHVTITSTCRCMEAIRKKRFAA
ncbi:MAG: hypothetical protein MJZ33_08105 [Paludibacteraceae bacterium]|nr:hypothetical protein [Paludibacteraceae bacterium]